VVFGPVTRFTTTPTTVVIAAAEQSIPTATDRVVLKTVASTLPAKPAMTRIKISSAVPSGFAISLRTTVAAIATAGAGRRTQTVTGKAAALLDAMRRVATYVTIGSEELHRVRLGYAAL